MNRWLCDTNVISELMRRMPNHKVVEWASNQQMFFLSVITVEEIHFGLEKKKLTKKKAWFEKFRDLWCENLVVDNEIAVRAGLLRGRLKSEGQTRTQTDILIAATAWKHGLTVVTRNTEGFNGCEVPLLNPF